MKNDRFPPSFIAAVRAQNRSEELYKAIKAKDDDTEQVVKAVEAGADLNRTYQDRLPLAWAIHFGKFNRFKLLCEIQPKEGAVANLNTIIPITDKKVEVSLLHYAAVKGLTNFVRYLVVERKIDATIQDKHSRKMLPIHHAAGSGNIATLDVLNDQNQALTAITGKGDYCVHIAVMGGQIAMLEHLLQLGANLSCRNAEGKTPLHCAIDWQQTATVDFLLTKNIPTQHCDAQGRNAYLLAVAKGDRELIKKLIKAGYSYEFCDANGMNALHIAAEGNHLSLLRSLNKLKKLSLHTGDNKGRRPIHLAIANDLIAIFDFIISEFAKEDIVNILLSWQDKNGETVVDYALRAKAKQITQRLVKLGLQFDRKYMLEATTANDVEMVKLLAGTGMSLNQNDSLGKRAEHIAAENGSIQLLEAFRKIPGVNFQVADNQGMLPIHYAASAGQKTTLEWLCQHQGGALTCQDQHGRDCLFHAARGDHSELVIDLVKAKKMSLNTRCAKKLTLMHHAVFKSAKKVVVVLKQFGMSIDVQDNKGMTPFLLACRSGLVNMIDYLIEHQANKKACNHSGKNAWFFAAAGCHDLALYLCLEKLELPFRADSSNTTPLHYAALAGNIVGLSYFIRLGQNHAAVDNMGETPLQKAHTGRTKAEKELVEKEKLQLVEECQQLKAKIADFNKVATYLISLDAPIEYVSGAKRERLEPTTSSDETRVVKPRLAANEKASSMQPGKN